MPPSRQRSLCQIGSLHLKICATSFTRICIKHPKHACTNKPQVVTLWPRKRKIKLHFVQSQSALKLLSSRRQMDSNFNNRYKHFNFFPYSEIKNWFYQSNYRMHFEMDYNVHNFRFQNTEACYNLLIHKKVKNSRHKYSQELLKSALRQQFRHKAVSINLT